MSSNYVHKLLGNCFCDLYNFKEVKIRNNKLIIIEAKSFCNLPNLKHIDLSNNILVAISKLAFHNISILDVLKINDNPLTFTTFDMISNWYTQALFTDKFPFCCAVSFPTTSINNKYWYNTCFQIFPHTIIIVISLVIFSVNIISVGKNIILTKRHKYNPFSIIAFSIHLGELNLSSDNLDSRILSQ